MGRSLWAAAVLWAAGQGCLAESLHVEFKGSDFDYLITEPSNVSLHLRHDGASFWTNRDGLVGVMNYEIPLNFYAQSGQLFAQSRGPVELRLSGDGSNWQSVALNQTVDIGPLIQNATRIYAEVTLNNGGGWLITESSQQGYFVLDVVGTAEPVPEPSSLIMGCLALAALVVAYRRR